MKNKKRFGIVYLNMIRSLVEFMFNAANAAITNSMAPFKSGAQICKTNLATIDNLRAQAKTVITGYAAQKRAMRKAITEISYNTMKSVYAFAKNTNNQNLIDAMSITKKDLNSMKMAEFISFVQATITTVSGYVNNLADYNVTQASVDNWQALLTDLQNLNSSPNNAINHRKMLNSQIQMLMGQTITYISQVMDSLSLNFQQSEPDYFMQYRNNRRLKGNTNHTKFKVRISDELDQPVYNVAVLQNNTTNEEFTDINGEATVFIKINEGADAQPVYQFTLTSGSKSMQSGPIEIKKGATVSRNYIMQPSGFIMPAPQDTIPAFS